MVFEGKVRGGLQIRPPRLSRPHFGREEGIQQGTSRPRVATMGGARQHVFDKHGKYSSRLPPGIAMAAASACLR